jgi:p-methyltransferase
MTSQEAMDHVENMFLTVKESEWLPFWSFDFWILPYLLGRGLTIEQIRLFTSDANRLLASQISDVSEMQSRSHEPNSIDGIVQNVRSWFEQPRT